jgi:hypothetical protein
MMKVSPHSTEKELREMAVPWPKSKSELTEFIDSLEACKEDYGTCVYAMSMAAVATFYYMSHIVGASGFQASCADMDIIRRTRNFKGPFMLIDGNDMLYPQYDIIAKVFEVREGWREWAKEEAAKLLATSNKLTSVNVINHWKNLAAWTPPEETDNGNR